MPQRKPSIRERTRLSVRLELSLLAQDLFASRGYDAITMDDIAAAAGLGRRTLFRYFSSKDELVLEKYDWFIDRIVEALAERPLDEPLWTSLRRSFDVVVEYFGAEPHRSRARSMEATIREHPSLYAGHLARIAHAQERLVQVVMDRGAPAFTAGPILMAVVGAAFSCLISAKAAWTGSERGESFGSMLDATMNAFAFPAGGHCAPSDEERK